jgi:hypothetical protein
MEKITYSAVHNFSWHGIVEYFGGGCRYSSAPD